MSQSGSETACPSCGKPVLPHFRRCAQCGAWIRPWSVGGKPSTWNRYKIGGAGRPEDWGTEMGSDAAGSVWEAYGPNNSYVRQMTASGEPAAARARRERERKARQRRSKG